MITTADFGGAWGQLPHEKSIMMNVPSINNPEAYKQAISSKLGFYPVEVINNEVISSGMANSMGGQVQVLLHCRVELNGQLTFTAKTSDAGVLIALEQNHLPSLA